MFTKFRDLSGEKVPYLLNFTQPNMAFTPRQIIEQFASGEIIAQENTPSDDFYDDKYSDDELASIRQIDDDFQARQCVLDFQIEQEIKQQEIKQQEIKQQEIKQQENETKTSTDVRKSSETTENSSTQSVSPTDVKPNLVDFDKASA